MVGLTSRAYVGGGGGGFKDLLKCFLWWDNDSQFDEPAYFSNWAMIKNTGYIGDEILPIYLWIIISHK